MRVFVTGGTGFIGSAVVEKLIKKGHQVSGLARSERSAEKLKAAGAEVVLGELTDLAVLKQAAVSADGVIHMAFDADFSRYEEANAEDLRLVKAIGESLAGTNKPFVVTSGTMAGAGSADPLTETTVLADQLPRIGAENAAIALAKEGVRSVVVRLAPAVHDETRAGLASVLLNFAKENQQVNYLGAGENLWPAIHRQDAADLFVKALESAPAGTRLHGVGETRVTTKQLATLIGEGLDLPIKSLTNEEGRQIFGWFMMAMEADNPASNTFTKELLDWNPTHANLMADLAELVK